MARGLAPDGRTKPGARVGWGAVAAGARALKEKAERSGASPCEFDYQVGRRGCLLLAIGPVREAQNPAASSRVLRASAVRSSTLYAIEDLRFTIYPGTGIGVNFVVRNPKSENRNVHSEVLQRIV